MSCARILLNALRSVAWNVAFTMGDSMLMERRSDVTCRESRMLDVLKQGKSQVQ